MNENKSRQNESPFTINHASIQKTKDFDVNHTLVNNNNWQKEELLLYFREMKRIRIFEEKCAELYTLGKIRGFLHLYIGEEAVATGVIKNISEDDAIVATYREHGQALVRGLSMNELLAEMYGKQEGCCRGRGGSMHIFSARHRFYGGNAIVGGGLPLAVGLALADKMQGNKRITCCFFGDGAVAEGEFHEALNLSALWKLPVLFCCENNQYGMGTALVRAESEPEIYRKALSYRIKAETVDGMDVLAVAAATRRAIFSIHESENPYFLEFKTYRFRGHSMFDAELYRQKSEIERWKRFDPLLRLENFLREENFCSPILLAEIERMISLEVNSAVNFAENGTWEALSDLTRDVYSSEEKR